MNDKKSSAIEASASITLWPSQEQLAAALQSMQTADHLFTWLVHGEEAYHPSDAALRSMDRAHLLSFLDSAPRTFEDSYYPSCPGGPQPFYDRLGQLRERVQGLE